MIWSGGVALAPAGLALDEGEAGRAIRVTSEE